jgi:acetyltransferase-like isoleucine patch superfamily enzyme
MIFIKAKLLYFKFKTFCHTILAKLKVESYGRGLKVNYKTNFTSSTIIGEDCHFNGMDIIGKGNVHIGDHFHSGSNILIITQNHNYFEPELLPYDNSDIVKDVIIGNCCWIGSRVIILPGTKLGDGVVVQAGSVLFGEIPNFAVVGGNPWKIIKFRNIDRYEKLVRENRYV